MKNIILNNELSVPQIGLGTYDLKADSIKAAMDIGYRLIDTAWQYGNETEVGKAVKESGVGRENVFITTKLWTDDIRSGKIREAFEKSLKNLQTDYLDLYLIHWPAKGFEKAWEVMTELYSERKIRAIGVSNFNQHHFEELSKISDIVPVLNQIESHPCFQNKDVIGYCRKNNIAVQAWCPLGGSFSHLVDNDIFKPIAAKHKKTPAQIILRWHLQREVMIIPRSSKKERLKTNIDLFDFNLDNNDMDIINKLDTGYRMGSDPDNFNF